MAVTYRLVVSLDSKGGSAVSSVSATYTGPVANKTLSVTPTAKPTKRGYTFKGWSPSTISVTIYSAQDHTVYKTASAIWSINTYSISFNANGGTDAPPAQVKTYDKTLVLSSAVPVLPGYDFVEWNTEKDGSGTAHYPGEEYTDNSKLSLFAQWRLSTFKVHYDANGGENAPAASECLPGEELTITEEEPSLAYHDFMGWAFTSDAAAPQLHGGDTYRPSRDVTVYAVWRMHSYRIQLDVHGGTVDPDVIYRRHMEKLEPLPVPVNPGNTFTGWYLNGEPVTEDTIFDAGEDITLEAGWQANTIHVTFSGNGAAIGRIEADYVHGGEYDHLPQPARWGYTFAGWSTDKAGTHIVRDGDTVLLTEDCTLFAIWVANPSDQMDYAFVWVRGSDGRMHQYIVLQKQNGVFVRRKTIIT